MEDEEMNKNIVYSIALGIAVSTAATFAADEAPAAVATVSAEELAPMPSNAELLERLEALETKAATEAKSGWAGKVRVKGDFRYRFQFLESEDNATGELQTEKNIQRIRARLGVFAEVNDFTEAAIGIRTGSKANSGNVTIGDGFAGKDISLSLAYLAMAPEDGKYGTATLGKMKQPWKATTDMIWDGDVNPEGAAYSYKGKVNDTGLIGSAGYFKAYDEDLTFDADLATLQGGATQPIGEKLKGTLGASMYYYKNVKDLPAAAYAVDYRIGEVFGEFGVKEVGPVPFKLYGNYVNNTAVEEENQGWCLGIKFGDAKKGKWEAKYDYRDLELFAAPGAFTDSDFADGGAGVKGHRIKGKYNFAKNLQGGLAFVYSERTPDGTFFQDQQFNTLILDLMVKF